MMHQAPTQLMQKQRLRNNYLMKREPFLIGAIAGVAIFYFLKKLTPRKRSSKQVKKTNTSPGDKV